MESKYNVEEKLKNLSRNEPDRCDDCGGEVDYIGLGEYKCRNCGKHLYDDYGKVRKYVEEFKGASRIEIAEFTGVDKEFIDLLIEEGTLVYEKESIKQRRCAKCGNIISRGRYCRSCMISTLSDIEGAFLTENKKTENNPTAKMRYLRRK